MVKTRTVTIFAVLAGSVCVAAPAASVSVAGGTAANPTDITAQVIANHDVELTGGNYVIRIPESGAGIVTAASVDRRFTDFGWPGFSATTNPTIAYSGVISGNGTVTVRSAFKPARPAYGQAFDGGALVFTSPQTQSWGVAGISSGGRTQPALIIDTNASVEFFFAGEADRQVGGAPTADAFPFSATVGRNIVNNGFLFSTTQNSWASITGTGVSSFIFWGGDRGVLGRDGAGSYYSGESIVTANGAKWSGHALIEDRPDGKPTNLVTRGLTVFEPSTSAWIAAANYDPAAPVKTVTQNMYNWGLNIQLWWNGIHRFTGIFLPTTASKTFLDLAPVADAVKGVYSYNGGGMAFGRVINLNHTATLLMGDGRQIVTNPDGVTNNTFLQGNPFNTLLSTSNFVGGYPTGNVQALAYAYSGTYRVNHNFNARADASKGIIQGIRNAPWTNLYFLDPKVYNAAATRPNNPILTTPVFFAGTVRIDRNVELQLGDGTTGNTLAAKTLTFSDGRTATYPYSDSSGNGMVMTKGNSPILTGSADDSRIAPVRFAIANNGKLIVNNTPGALDATTAGATETVAAWVTANELDGITGVGSIEQRGALPLTLGAAGGNANSYTGGTTIAAGATAIAGSATAFGKRDAAAGAVSGRVHNAGTLKLASGVRTLVISGDYVQSTTAPAQVAAATAPRPSPTLPAMGVMLAGMITLPALRRRRSETIGGRAGR